MDDTRLAALHRRNILDTDPEPAFDDVAQLAAQLCAAPVALVSLVDADQQWFKARIGFPPCETDRDRSVCSFVVQKRGPVIISDLTADPRTRHNPLVTDEPHIRFYAGAPLTTLEGHVLGALCVLDLKPRPEGLSPDQLADLSALARRVVELIELRQLNRDHQASIIERDRAETHRAGVDFRWQQLFDRLDEGFILGSVIRDVNDRVVDWRYDQVNGAWSRLVGITGDQVIGRTVRDILPEIEPEWIDDFDRVVDTGEPFDNDAAKTGAIARRIQQARHFRQSAPRCKFIPNTTNRNNGSRFSVMTCIRISRPSQMRLGWSRRYSSAKPIAAFRAASLLSSSVPTMSVTFSWSAGRKSIAAYGSPRLRHRARRARNRVAYSSP